MQKKLFSFRSFIQHLFLIFCISFLFPLKTSALPVGSTFVVLPFSSDSALFNLKNSLTESLIENLKKNGYNAIGTRYLTSILKMENCNTSECMKKITSLVGARYTIYGALSGDTVTFNVSFHMKDISQDNELINEEKMLVGGMQAISQLSRDLTTLVSQSIKGDNPDSVNLQALEPHRIETPPNLQLLNINPDSTINQAPSDQNVSDPILKPDSLINTYADNKDTSIKDPDTLKPELPVSEKSVSESGSISTEIPQATMQSPSPSTIHSTKDTIIPKIYYPQSAYEPPPVKKRSIFKPLPSKFSQQGFRNTRLLVFGNLTAAGLISGLVINDRVKKSLDKETELYKIHQNAEFSDNATTYNDYIRQTEKTDRYTTMRKAIYAASGIFGLGFSISVFF